MTSPIGRNSSQLLALLARFEQSAPSSATSRLPFVHDSTGALTMSPTASSDANVEAAMQGLSSEQQQELMALVDIAQLFGGTSADLDSEVAQARQLVAGGSSPTTPGTTPGTTPTTPGTTPTTPAATTSSSVSTQGANGSSGITGPVSGTPGPSATSQSCPTGALDASTLGVKGDGSTDDTQALQSAINQAKANGQALYLPPGTYNHSGALNLDGVKLTGAGDKTVLNATSPTGAAVVLTGNGAGLSNLAVNSPSNTRTSQPKDAAVLLQDANNASVSNISTQGASSNGIRLANSNNCTVSSSFINGSNADGIALTDGSCNNTVRGCQVESAGDDSYSDDSYNGEKQDSGNTFDSDYAGPNFSQGRGFALMGSTNATVKNCVSDGAKDYGIIAGTDPKSNTQKGSNFTITNNLVTNNGAGAGNPTLLTDVGDVSGAQNDPSLGNVSGTKTTGDAGGLLGWSPLTTFTQRSQFSSYQGGGDGSNNNF